MVIKRVGCEGRLWAGMRGVGRSSPVADTDLRALADTSSRARSSSDRPSASIASASVTTELLKGRALRSALDLGPEEIEAALGGLPESRKYCAEYAARAARAAAEDSLSRISER